MEAHKSNQRSIHGKKMTLFINEMSVLPLAGKTTTKPCNHQCVWQLQ